MWNYIVIVIMESVLSKEIWISGLTTAGKTIFNETGDNMPLQSWGNFVIMDGIYAFAWVTSWVSKIFVSFFCDVTAFVAITLWSAASRFALLVEKDISVTWNENHSEKSMAMYVIKSSKWKELYGAYKVIRQLSQMIHDICGSVIMIYTGIAIIQCTSAFEYLLATNHRSVGEFVHNSCWILEEIAVLCVSANTCSQVRHPYFHQFHKEGLKNLILTLMNNC